MRRSVRSCLTEKWKCLERDLSAVRCLDRYPRDSSHRHFEAWERILHRAYKQHLTQIIWPRKVAPILRFLALNQLNVHVHNAMCHSQCCDLTKAALSTFAPGFAKGVPSEVNVLGQPSKKWREQEIDNAKYEGAEHRMSVAVKIGMNGWTQQRHKRSYSVREGFQLMKNVFIWMQEEEERLGGW